MRPYRRQLLVLVPLMGVVALVAQVAGVGTTERDRAPRASTKALATIPGGTVPDVGSTVLGQTSLRASKGEVVRMRATVRVQATDLPRGQVAQVVCGIRYSRAGDPSWTLGSAYETVVLDRRGARERVQITRSFAAPARDRYQTSAACHVVSPRRGARITASGEMRSARGLPAGAAIPVG
jgi:hypothetical protein